MGLYLCIYDPDDEEVDGVEVGSYQDFADFREAVLKLEGARPGRRFPLLMTHSDCDGEWRWEFAEELQSELEMIRDELRQFPPLPELGEWQSKVAAQFRIRPQNLAESFFDVDGTPLLDRLIELAKRSSARELDIVFQ